MLLTGYPGSGKTLFSQQELQSRNYTRITDLKTPLEPNTSYAIELIDLVTAEGRKRAVAHARKSGLPVRLLQIEPPGGGPNGAWRQLVWEEHCLGRRIQAANPFAQNAGRTSKLIAKSFAETCQKASFPHPQSEEAAEFVNGVELVWWSYRGPLAQRERFFRVSAASLSRGPVVVGNNTTDTYNDRSGPRPGRRRTRISRCALLLNAYINFIAYLSETLQRLHLTC